MDDSVYFYERHVKCCQTEMSSFFILEPCPILHYATELAPQHVDGRAVVRTSSTPDSYLQPARRSKFLKPVLAQSA
jgi:hypothetical protein